VPLVIQVGRNFVARDKGVETRAKGQLRHCRDESRVYYPANSALVVENEEIAAGKEMRGG
jgi:hypothetical protein